MKKGFFYILIMLITAHYGLYAQKIKASGGMGDPYVYKENLVGTGIEAVYLFNGLSGASISFTSSSPSIRIYRYKNSLADKQLIPQSDISETQEVQGTVYTVSNLMDGYGYYIDTNPIRVQWVIDYSLHQTKLHSIVPVEDDDKCDLIKLLIDKQEDLFYYTTSGIKRTVTCRYNVSYNTMEWKDDRFNTKLFTSDESQIASEFIVSAPLEDTHFSLSGDQFARHFRIDKVLQTGLYHAVATEAHINYEQDSDNKVDNSPGGSAPLTIHFQGYANEPVSRFYTWNIYNVKDLNNPIIRFTDKDISYTFDKSGNYKVVLEVANRESSCSDTTSISFKITESFLDVPNFFVTGSVSGVNNEFKVAYKSLVRFKCTIFNRWGVKLYEWKDPSVGWDGRHNGRYVSPGAYYYVIDAEGADGVKYKRGGDINILHK